MDRYSEMEMTKIGRAEFKRGKAQAKEEILKEIESLIKDNAHKLSCGLPKREIVVEVLKKLRAGLEKKALLKSLYLIVNGY